MCGIAGVVSRNSPASAAATLEKMLACIVHRGPDGQGTMVRERAGRTVALGMRRLAIVDLSTGDQPISSPKNQHIVMNGEIYNFQSLRQNLSDYPFKTRSDTEVALASFTKSNTRAVEDWQGMFATAIYDEADGKLYLFRDRFGKKPLYYCMNDQGFWFGSELKSLIAGMEQRPGVSGQSVQDYLAFRYVPSPATIWDGIYKLPPGSILTLNIETMNFSIAQYWRPQVQSQQTADHALEQFTQLFHNAVEKRLLASDVPVGILLSGGLDSSAVAAAAKELGHRELNSYSVHFDHPAAFNEQPYADLVAAHVNTKHHRLIMTVDQFRDDLSRLAEMTDEPLADLATIPLFRVCEFAQKDVKVLMSGEGSDEILAGYHYDQLARKYDILRVFKIIPASILQKLPHPLLQRMGRVGWSGLARDLASHPTLGTRQSAHAIELVLRAYDECTSPELIDQMQEVMMQDWLIEDLLMKADKASMAASVELRCPFLDHDLAEFCFKLPMQWKVGSFAKGYTTKCILREYAQTRLPASTIHRSKQGFPVPSSLWLRNDLSSWAQDIFMDSNLDNIMPKNERQLMWSNFKSGAENNSHDIWRLIILSLWQKRWLA